MNAHRYFRTELLDDAAAGDAHSDRWVVSYADFITLMFAFFVVMYSISSVNDGKFRVLSASLVDVFSDPRVNAALNARLRAAAPEASQSGVGDVVDPLALDPLSLRSEELAAVLATRLAEPIADGTLRVRESRDWTEVELGSAGAFDGPSQHLAADAAALIDTLGGLVQAMDVAVRVEGFSDRVAAAAGGEASSLERSAAQAAAVAARLVAAGVDGQRISATGFGELHAPASAASAAGPAANQRVVVAIARHDRVPDAAVSLAARQQRDELPQQTLQRVTKLPGTETIRF
ncbi:MAG: flagellar motor protein MotB [Gammaproteobacteria bacterium]